MSPRSLWQPPVICDPLQTGAWAQFFCMKDSILVACALLAWGWCSSLHAPSNCLDLDAFYVLGEIRLDELYFKGDHNTPLSIDFSFMISWEQGELHNLRGYEIFFLPSTASVIL